MRAGAGPRKTGPSHFHSEKRCSIFMQLCIEIQCTKEIYIYVLHFWSSRSFRPDHSISSSTATRHRRLLRHSTVPAGSLEAFWVSRPARRPRSRLETSPRTGEVPETKQKSPGPSSQLRRSESGGDPLTSGWTERSDWFLVRSDSQENQ